MIIKIDTDKIAQLESKGTSILISQDGEKVLAELLEIQETIEEAISGVKQSLEEAALEIDPNFSSIQGELVKVSYRAYGSKYKIDQSQIKNLSEELYTTKVLYSPNSKEIDKFYKEKGALPLGVEVPERKKQISIKRKDA